MGRPAFRSYFSFDGRFGRLEFLGALTLAGIPAMAAGALSFVLFGKLLTLAHLLNSLGLSSRASPVSLQQAIFIVVSFIPTAWMLAAGSVKRAHDRGKSGWWVLLFFVPYVGPIWWVIDLVVMDGQHGSNEYGDDPRATAVASK